jgi:hypothetical protein
VSHVHMNSSKLNLRKRYRLAIRASVCLIFCLIPLVHNLNSLQLIGTVAALLWFVVALETWGNAEKCHVWIGERTRKEYVCKFNVRCVQGEETIIEDENETRTSEDGDIIFGV